MKLRNLLLCLILASPNLAAASNFVTVNLPRGIEVQLPKGWWVLTPKHNQLIDMSTEAVIDLSGFTAPEGAETNLIATNSMPRETYAAVRVDSTTPASGSRSEVANVSEAELTALGHELHNAFKQLIPMQGNQLLDFYGTSSKVIAGHPALITQYRRSGSKGPVLVGIVQIFTPSQDLRINLSYRESEQAIWKPVIQKVFQSLVIHQWP